MLRTLYTPDNNHIHVSIPDTYIGRELEILVFPINENEEHHTFSKSMQKALDDEKYGRITKLVNHKDAVAEILG